MRRVTDTTTSTSSKAHTGRVPGWAFVVLLALGATVLGWPAQGLRPVAGLDPSWILGLHLAGDAGLHLGEDIAFTFGPLGTLSRPILIDHGAYVPGMLVRAFVMSGTAAIVAHHAVRLLGRVYGAVLTLVLVPLLLVPFGRGADPELLVVFAALLLTALARRSELAWWHGGAGLLVGVVLFLAKVSSGFTGLLLWGGWLALSLIVRRRERLWWTLIAWAAAAPIVLLLGGFLTGFSVGGLVDYVRNGIELTAGFAAGMHNAHPATLWHLLAFFLAAGLVGVGVALRLRQATFKAGEWVAAAVLVAFAFTRLKYGFTREGPGHLLPAVGAMVVLAMATWPTGRVVALGAPHEHRLRRASFAVWAVPVVAVASMVMVLRGVADAWITPGHAADAAADLVSLVSSDDGDPRFELLNAYGLGALGDVEGRTPAVELPAGTIHVDPWDAALVWALGRDEDWSPPPVFQSYSAYTPRLDRLNAAHLAGPDGPDVVLRLPKMIDGRNPAWDPPRHLLALACNYDLDQVVQAVPADGGDSPIASGRWSVLTRRASPRCDALGPMDIEVRSPMVLGQWFDRPRPVCGDRLTVFSLGYEPTGIGAALRTLAWVPPEVRVEADLADGRTISWRWLPAFAFEPMLLDAPDDVRWALQGSSSAITRMRVVRADDVLQPPTSHPFEVRAGCL